VTDPAAATPIFSNARRGVLIVADFSAYPRNLSIKVHFVSRDHLIGAETNGRDPLQLDTPDERVPIWFADTLSQLAQQGRGHWPAMAQAAAVAEVLGLSKTKLKF